MSLCLDYSHWVGGYEPDSVEPGAQGPRRALPGPPGGAHGPPVLPNRRPGGHLLRRHNCQTVDAVHVRLGSVQMGSFFLILVVQQLLQY